MQFHSQIGQDQWVHSVLGDKRYGFFVELGACDGISLSNTLFFERSLNWNGICIEPEQSMFDQLVRNRTCYKANDLVSDVAGKSVEFGVCGAVSGVLDDTRGPFTESRTVVRKTTNTLGNVLDRFGAPSVIDYLSLDVEGYEYKILSTFPFEKYQFRCITVEHNAPHVGTYMQEKIRKLLTENGYTFVKGNDNVQGWGHGPIDDFYVKPELV